MHHHKLNVSMNYDAGCPCHHHHNENKDIECYCEHSEENVISDIEHLDHQHISCNSEHIAFSEECCEENKIDIAIDDVFSFNNYKINFEINSDYELLPINIAYKKEANKSIINKFITTKQKYKTKYFFPASHIYLSSSNEDDPYSSII